MGINFVMFVEQNGQYLIMDNMIKMEDYCLEKEGKSMKMNNVVNAANAVSTVNVVNVVNAANVASVASVAIANAANVANVTVAANLLLILVDSLAFGF